MRDTELYRAILGLTPPWTVGGVELNMPEGQVVVRVEAGPGPFVCPECGSAAERYDSRPRRWRHLDTCQLTTWIEADVPRIDCATHGVKQIRVPWAEPGSQFTVLFERLAIDLLWECSVTGAKRVLRISWDEAWGIKTRAVRRGLARRQAEVVPHLGVDEKAIAKRHRYLTVVADLERNRVLYLADDRKQESLDGFWATLTAAQVAGIEAMAMDMWEPYVQSTRAHLPDADRKIVFDKFHVVKHLHDAVDQVRRGEHRALKRTGDDRLTGSKYLWLMRPKDMTPDQQTAFRLLQRQDLKVARAWLLKERFAAFWDYTYPGAAETFTARWYWRATHSRLKPMAGVAKLIKRHLPNLLTYLTHKITNAGLEAVNSVIQGVKKTARGFRNPEHFKIAIYFRCGGLDLYPHESR
ncbi:MAG: ISL3 family transposase [Myxococcaceae bacterium]